MNATNDDSVAREYRYVVVLADGRVYDPDKPISKKEKELLDRVFAEEMEDEEGDEQEAEVDLEGVLGKLPFGSTGPAEWIRDQLEETIKKKKQEVTERREKIQKVRSALTPLRETLLVKLNDLLAQGWVPLRETPFGYGCLLVLTRRLETEESLKGRSSSGTTRGRR